MPGLTESAITPLGFVLPSFTRIAWVNEAARQTWSPRAERLLKVWRAAEWQSVCAGVRPCAFLQYYSDEYAALDAEWKKRGLKVAPLRLEQRADGKYFVEVAVGARREARHFKNAWVRRDHNEMGKLLGYPECCRAFFRTWFEKRRWNDPSWLIAAKTGGAVVEGTTVTAYGHPLVNPLLRYGVGRAIPHLPCGFDCAASCACAERFLMLYTELGFAEEAAWLREILDWPMEWSALHGILEVRTPLMKLCANADAFAEKLTVRWLGRSIPAGAARGLGFPYLAA